MTKPLHELPPLPVDQLWTPTGPHAPEGDLVTHGLMENLNQFQRRNPYLMVVYNVFRAAIHQRTESSEYYPQAIREGRQLSDKLSNLPGAEALCEKMDAVNEELPSYVDGAVRRDIRQINKNLQEARDKGVNFYVGVRLGWQATRDVHLALIHKIAAAPSDQPWPMPVPVFSDRLGRQGLMPADHITEKKLYEARR